MALMSMFFHYATLSEREIKGHNGCFLITTEFFILVCISHSYTGSFTVLNLGLVSESFWILHSMLVGGENRLD